MVWYWAGPDAIDAAAKVLAAAADGAAKTAAQDALDKVNADSGLIFQWGAIDFAGGTVVHINAGIAGLVGAFVLGKRIGYGKESMTPHSLTMCMIGASMLWFGWFGFNAGSALEAGSFAALAFLNTYLATAAAVCSWIAIEWIIKGKPSMLGAASGAVAGLVAITPAAGNVGIMGGLIIGLGVGVVCFWGVTGLKKLIGADDSLDVFGVHALGGIFGALMTGIFNAPSLGGPGLVVDWVTASMGYPGIGAQFLIQLKAVLIVVAWSGVVSLIGYYIVKFTVGLRVTEEEEREGLDISAHGERAYTA
jgi:Amt family ammonium transporter